MNLVGVPVRGHSGAVGLATYVTVAITGVGAEVREGAVHAISIALLKIAPVGVRVPARIGPLVAFLEASTFITTAHLYSRVSAWTLFKTTVHLATTFDTHVAPMTTFRTQVSPMVLYVGSVAQIDTELDFEGVGDPEPTALTLTVITPSGVSTTYVYGTDAKIVKVGTRKYRALIDCTEASFGDKTWGFEWISPGPIGKGADRGYFDVDP